MTNKGVILGVTGSIAAYKSAQIVRRLKEMGLNVTVVMTEEATKFISPLTLQTLSGNRVYKDLFGAQDSWDPLHISLAKRADLILIAPATANFIAKAACGLGDDALSCTLLSTDAQVLIAPAMNQRMYKNRIVQENIRKLKGLGYEFIAPIKGKLACGYQGLGHLASVETIIEKVKKALR